MMGPNIASAIRIRRNPLSFMDFMDCICRQKLQFLGELQLNLFILNFDC